jgi:hypothetical protein
MNVESTVLLVFDALFTQGKGMNENPMRQHGLLLPDNCPAMHVKKTIVVRRKKINPE